MHFLVAHIFLVSGLQSLNICPSRRQEKGDSPFSAGYTTFSLFLFLPRGCTGDCFSPPCLCLEDVLHTLYHGMKPSTYLLAPTAYLEVMPRAQWDSHTSCNLQACLLNIFPVVLACCSFKDWSIWRKREGNKQGRIPALWEPPRKVHSKEAPAFYQIIEQVATSHAAGARAVPTGNAGNEKSWLPLSALHVKPLSKTT